MASEFLPSVCPHDCPSVCALEVERLDGGRLGKVRGSNRNSYTAGVICAKVARYHERFHHPDRLSRAAASGRAEGFGTIRADRLGRCPRRGRRGLRARRPAARARDRLALLLRRHHGPRAARRHQPAAPRHALFRLAHHDLRHALGCRLARGLRPALGRAVRGDGALRPDRDLGHQSREHPGQRHDPRRPGAQGAGREARGGRPLPDRHRRAGGRAHRLAAGHRRRARLRGDARPVPRRLRGSRLPRRTTPTTGGRRRRISRPGRPNGPPGSPACRSPRSRTSPGSTARPGAPICGSASASRARAMVLPTCTRRPACRS